MELDFRKKSRRDRMICSKSFETQEVREIGRNEEGESRSFPILCMRILEDVFYMEGKECTDQERSKMCGRKFMHKRERYFSMGKATLSGPAAVNKERFVAAAKNSAVEKEEQKKNETRQGTCLGGARTGSLCFYYARPLAGNGKEGFQVVGEDRSRLSGRGTVG